MLFINITPLYDEIRRKKKMKAMECKMLEWTGKSYEEKINRLINIPCMKILIDGNERSDIQEQEMLKNRLRRLGYL